MNESSKNKTSAGSGSTQLGMFWSEESIYCVESASLEPTKLFTISLQQDNGAILSGENPAAASIEQAIIENNVSALTRN